MIFKQCLFKRASKIYELKLEPNFQTLETKHNVLTVAISKRELTQFLSLAVEENEGDAKVH